MKIVFCDVGEAEKSSLEGALGALLTEHEVVCVPTTLRETDDEILADAEVLSVFVHSEIDETALGRMPKLKLVTTRSTGFDHIDKQACERREVGVANVPNYGSATVAEYTFALLFALAKKIYYAIEQVREAGDMRADKLEGIELEGKTLAVIGTGKIGQKVIRIAKGLDMEVVAVDSFPNEELAAQLGFRYANLETALRAADVVSLHVPALPETEKLINRESLSWLKPSALLINTARGSLIDTEALVEALKVGKLSGAALDVLPEEDLMLDEATYLFNRQINTENFREVLANHVLIDLPNVLVTPHAAFNTREAKERIIKTTVMNISTYLEGKPTNIVI